VLDVDSDRLDAFDVEDQRVWKNRGTVSRVRPPRTAAPGSLLSRVCIWRRRRRAWIEDERQDQHADREADTFAEAFCDFDQQDDEDDDVDERDDIRMNHQIGLQPISSSTMRL